VDARLEHVLDAGLATVQRLLDGAVTPSTSAKRARRRATMAIRRLVKMRRKVVSAGEHGRVSASCEQTIATRLDDLRAATGTLLD
jgi:hypothetical protein